MLKSSFIAACALVSIAPATAQTVETTAFITSPTATNGFEGLGALNGSEGVTSYSENGITVDYVGNVAFGGIWSTSVAAPEGQYSWYPNGGGTGYTQISFAAANQIQFLASSGFFGGDISLAYELLFNGASIASGVAGPLTSYEGGFTYYGFSGAVFDQVRLQGVQGVPSGFDPASFEALSLDAIAISAAGVPEPATWALMILGMGAVGGAMRRRTAVKANVRFA